MTVLEGQAVIPREAKEAFWKTIEKCLIKFHGFNPEKAQKACLELYANIESMPIEFLKKKEEYDSDIFYHNEPFYVACNLAQNSLDLKEHYQAYKEILSEAEIGGERKAG